MLADGLSLEFEWHQVSKTLLSILADLNNAVDWVASTRPVISKSSRLCTNPFVTVLKAPITIGITVTIMFLSFCCCFFSIPLQGLGTYPSFRFLSILLCFAGIANSTILQVLFGVFLCWGVGFFFMIIRSDILAYYYHSILLICCIIQSFY